jgi:hypothetical protein
MSYGYNITHAETKSVCNYSVPNNGKKFLPPNSLTANQNVNRRRRLRLLPTRIFPKEFAMSDVAEYSIKIRHNGLLRLNETAKLSLIR